MSRCWIGTKRFQLESPLTCTSWKLFGIPARQPNKVHRDSERQGDFRRRILEEIEVSGYDGQLSPRWLHFFLMLLRFALSRTRLAELASYIDKWLRATDRLAAALQAADEMRACNELLPSPADFKHRYRGFGTDSKSRWQTDALWQPLRIAIEKLLVCYDWGESFVGLNIVLKPLIDELFMTTLAIWRW